MEMTVRIRPMAPKTETTMIARIRLNGPPTKPKAKPKARTRLKPRPGRPTAYLPIYAKQAAKLCARGAIDVELADNFGVSVSTLYNWKNKYPEFLQATKIAKETADDRVERSLYQKATGYTVDAVKIFLDKEGDLRYARYRENVAPDTTAAIFWLKNRRRDQWADWQRREITGNEGGPIELIASTMPPEKAAQLYQDTLAIEANDVIDAGLVDKDETTRALVPLAPKLVPSGG